jgi:predicted transcriptional regulator
MANGRSLHSHWYLVSSHGAVLFFVALHPDCTIKEIAEEMSLTQRTVWGLIGDLRRADMLAVRRVGRRHHYTVNLDATFRHPVIQGIPLRVVLGELVSRFARRREPVEAHA